MPIPNKYESKIFLTFFLIYFLFIHWAGWYENSIFALTRAIVDEGRFEIDSYANQTSDRAYFNNHYYSDKAPGTSLIAVPTYAIWKFIYYNFFSPDFREKHSTTNEYNIDWSNEKTSLIIYVNPGFFLFLSMIFITVFTATFFITLTVILIYKISRYFTKNENHKLLITFIYGAGSLAFPNALSIFMHQTGTFFIFLAFYLIFKIKNEKIKNNKYFLLAGISLGLAFMSDFYMVLTGVILFFYFIFLFNSKSKKGVMIFILGCFIGFLPFLLYNFSILGPRLELLGKYNDRNIFTEVPEEIFNRYGFITPSLNVIFQILFGVYRGLLFYYPVYSLSFIGLCLMFKNYKKEAILIFLIFIFSLILTSSRITWHGGYTFGPRYLLPSIPFLTIPILFTFKDLKEKIPKVIIFLLIVFSIFVNLLGLQILEDFITNRQSLLIDKEYQNKINNFQQLPNILYEYYIPLFLQYGPRSLIFENLVDRYTNIDIRDVPLSSSWNFPYIAEHHIPFLSFIPLGIIIFLIWRKELLVFFYKFFNL